MTLTDEIKHTISVLFVEEMHRLNAGLITLSQMNTTVDEVAAMYPGGEQQQDFYAAIRELARKVSVGETSD